VSQAIELSASPAVRPGYPTTSIAVLTRTGGCVLMVMSSPARDAVPLSRRRPAVAGWTPVPALADAAGRLSAVAADARWAS
jgi:hypothetical protein